jgi:hypothetical protein
LNLLEKYYSNQEVKEIIEKYRTPIQWHFFKDREWFCQKYNVAEKW